jgi:predicted flap endonuclease-1-like 5' DNA nuclease
VFDFILKILVCLLIAAAIGFVMAWLLRGLGLAKLTDRISQLMRNVAERDATIHDRDTKIKDVRSTLSARDSTILAHETRLSTLDSQLSQVNQQRDSLSLDVSGRDSLIKARDVSLASLTALVASRDMTINEQKTAIEAGQSIWSGAQANLQAGLASKDLALQDLQKQITDNQKLMADRDNMLRVRDETLKNRELKIEELERSIATQAGKFAVERDQLSVKLNGFETAQKNAVNVASNLGKEKDSEIARLTAQMATLVALPAMMTQKDQQLTAARNEANAARNDLLTFKAKMDQTQTEQKSRTDLWAQFNVEFDANKRTLASRSLLLTEAQTRLSSLERNEQSSRDQLRLLETQLKQSSDTRRALEEELAAFRLADKERSARPPRQFTHAPALVDDIKHIYGVGPALEVMLNKLGIYLFKQVALWSEQDIDFFDNQLHEFHGRIRREHWVRSAVEEHYKKYGEWLAAGQPSITLPETNRD